VERDGYRKKDWHGGEDESDVFACPGEAQFRLTCQACESMNGCLHVGTSLSLLI
jgi:hypothetical protein